MPTNRTTRFISEADLDAADQRLKAAVLRDAEINQLVESVRRKALDDFIRECPPDLQERINIELRRRSHIASEVVG